MERVIKYSYNEWLKKPEEKMERNDLSFRIIETDSDKELAKEIVENYHSYVPTYKSVGRRLDWLIFYEGALVGMIGIGSSTYPPCKDILRRLKINKEQYKKMFNSFANNWRFCMKERIPNLGTRVLKFVRMNAPIDWKKYVFLISIIASSVLFAMSSYTEQTVLSIVSAIVLLLSVIFGVAVDKIKKD